MMQAYPQNYLYLGISSPLVLALFVVTLIKLMKNSGQRGLFVKLFLLVVLVVVLYNWLIKWVVSKNYLTTGWVLATIPLLSIVFMAYYYVEHEQCLGSLHSVFSECLPHAQQRMVSNIVNRLN
jgi:hypothetical protein